MRRWRRIALLGAIFAGAAVVVGGWYQLRQMQITREAQIWKERGIAAAQNGDAEQAIILLGQYLRRTPSDAKALEAYVQARPLAQGGDQPQARQEIIWALQELLRLQNGRDDLRRQLLDLYVQNEDRAQALNMADALLAHSPQDAHVLALKAAVLMSQGDWPQAMALVQDWTGRLPLDVEGQCAFLMVMKQMGAPPAQILRRAVQLRSDHPADARFALLEGFALRLTDLPGEPGDHKTAADWLRSAAVDAPPLQDAKFVRALVDQLDQIGMFDQSLDLLRRAGTAAGADAGIRRDLGRRLWEIGQWDAALPLLAEQAGATGRQADEALGLQGLADMHKGAEAEVSRIRAELAQRSRDPVAAGWQAILDQAAYPEESTPKHCAEACRQAIGCDASNIYLTYFLAQAYERLGETDLTLALLQDICTRNRTWVLPPLLRAQILLSQGRAAAALAAAQEARRRSDSAGTIHDVDVALALAWAWDAQLRLSGDRDTGQIEELRQMLATLEVNPASRDIALGIELGLLSRTGKRPLAQEKLRQALKQTAAIDASALLNWEAISRANHLNLEDACLERCAAERGSGPNLAYAQAALLQARGKTQEGRELLENAQKRSLRPDALVWRIAQAQYLDLIHDPAAAAAWHRIVDEQADNVAVQRLAWASPSVQGDRDFAQRTIQRLRETTGVPGVAWRLEQARWLLDDANGQGQSAQQAAALLNEALQSVPESPQAHWLLGRTLGQTKNLAGAAEELLAANKLDPQSAPIILDLAQLQLQRGESERAMQTLQSLSDPRCVVAQAQLLFSQNHLREAAHVINTLEADQIEQLDVATRQKLDNLRTRLQKTDKPTQSKAGDNLAPPLAERVPPAKKDHHESDNIDV